MPFEASDETFVCPQCQGRARIFYSEKTGERAYWVCTDCLRRGFWALEKAIVTA
jgi:hypothetical protein